MNTQIKIITKEQAKERDRIENQKAEKHTQKIQELVNARGYKEVKVSMIRGFTPTIETTNTEEFENCKNDLLNVWEILAEIHEDGLHFASFKV